MRLLMTTDTVGGVWTFTSELTHQLLAQGHTVHLVSFGRAPSHEQQTWANKLTQASSVELEGTNTHSRGSFTYTASDLALEWMQDNQQVFEQGQALLLSRLQEHPMDIIVSNQFCFGRLGTSIPRIVVAHSDVLGWARACRPTALDPSPWLHRYTAMVQAGLLDAAAVVTPTASMGSALKTNFFLFNKCLTIPNGVSVAAAVEPVPERKLQAVTAGRLWDEAKGLDTLRHWEGDTPPMPLLIAGDNALDAGTPPTAWPPHLKNLGPLSRSDLHQHFRESAIYLCTSRYEPFGLAPLEAALCGCAVVARDLPSLREVWADAALFFTDTASLAATLDALANDPNILAEAQARACERAKLFTPERMADNYLRLFQSVLEQSQALQHVA